MMKMFTAHEFTAYINEQYGPVAPSVAGTVSAWLDRGDGAAIYENHDMGSPDLGLCQVVSFGSRTAQLEYPEPPERLPDIGGAINWRFMLVGTYRRPSWRARDAEPTDGTTRRRHDA